MSRLLKAVFFVAGLFVSSCSGQGLLDEVNFKSAQLGGLHLVGVSVFSGYSTSAYPEAGYSLGGPTNIGNLGPDESFGASASMGWQTHGEKTNISVMYTGTYEGMVHTSGLNAFDQSLSVSASRMLTPKWTFSVTAAGQDASLAQLINQPSALSVVSGLPASFDDLAAALAVGQYSSAQVASMLTGAPILQAPGRSLLVGNRVLSYTGQAMLGYALSSRVQLHFASIAAAGQNRLGSQEGVTPPNYVMPRSLGANAGVGITYSLSPRTDLGVNVDENRTANHFQTAYVSTASASLGRKMGEHWFVRARGGGTYSDVTQQLLGSPKIRQFVGGGSLGFQTHDSTLVGSYDRAATDTFGFAVGTITTLSGVATGIDRLDQTPFP